MFYKKDVKNLTKVTGKYLHQIVFLNKVTGLRFVQNDQWDWVHISIKLGTKHVIYQKIANFLRVWSLACKFLYYGAESNAKGGPDEKYGVVCLVIMFTPKVIIIKKKKMARFLYFFSDGSKKLITDMGQDR